MRSGLLQCCALAVSESFPCSEQGRNIQKTFPYKLNCYEFGMNIAPMGVFGEVRKWGPEKLQMHK